MSVYRRLLPFIRPHTGRLTGAMGANVLAALCDAFSMALLIPFLNVLFDQPPLDIQSETIRTMLNLVLQHFDIVGRPGMAALRSVILVVILVIILKNVLIWIGGQLGASLQEYVTRDLRNAVYRHLAHLPLGFYTRTKAGQIISRVINDTFEARLVLTQIVTQAFQALSMVFASIVFLVAISPQLTLLALVVAPVLMVILQPLLKKLRRGNRRRGVQHGEMTSVLQETIGGARLIKSFGTETFEEQRFSAASNTYARSSFRLTRLALLAGPLSEVVIMGIAMVLLWVGARQVLVSQEMSGADLLAFLMYILRMMSPLKQLLGIPATAQSSLASAERLFEILDTPAEDQTDKGTRTVTQFERDIVFDNVSFAYELPPATAQYPIASSKVRPANTLPVLHDVSFTAKQGELIALVGASGAGKTTLVDLIPRFYEPTSGRIMLDGVDTQTITLSSLRSLMGIVSQDTVLFHDSVRNNIAYGKADKYTDAQIEAAARAANAHEFIESLPKGYETTLGDRGARLSGGQRQRLAIARALLNDPPILILDEATSALDTESEQLVQAAVDRLLEGRTVFVIAHRLSTVRNATQILVLDQGRIVERGTHAELLAMEGVYARLHALQFSASDASASQQTGDQATVLPSPSSPLV